MTYLYGLQSYDDLVELVASKALVDDSGNVLSDDSGDLVMEG